MSTTIDVLKGVRWPLVVSLGVLALIRPVLNIFGVMDVNEELPVEGQGVEEMSPEDIEAAIAPELGGGVSR